MDQREAIEYLFRPRSIAVVGATDSAGKIGQQIMASLSSFEGAVYPVNPRVDTVAGRKAYANLDALDESPDLLVLAVPAQACLEVIATTRLRGPCGAVIFSGGFAESGATGAQRQSELRVLCEENGIRLLGPNTSGFLRPAHHLYASFVTGARCLETGDLGIIAQSGGVNLAIAYQAARAGAGISLAAGLGNAANVDAADVVRFLADDEETRAILLHLEGVARGRELYQAIAEAVPRKPVVALAVGRHDVGTFARSHTGNLIGSNALTRTALRQAGAVVVDTLTDLVDAGAALARRRATPRSDPGVALVSAQAGPALLMLDRLKGRAVSVPPLSRETQSKISQLLPPLTFTGNPVDTGRPSDAMPRVVGVVAEDPAVDILGVFALEEPAALNPLRLFDGTAGPATRELPVVYGTGGPPPDVAETLAALREFGVTGLPEAERAADVLAALAEDAAGRYRLGRPFLQASPVDATLSTIPATEFEAKAILAERGLRVPEGRVCSTYGEALRAFDELHAPVALKVLDESIAHKTETGGVHLDIRDPEQLEACLRKVDAIPAGNGERRYLVEKMADPGLDLIVGATRHESFGPLVMVGLGGTAAEAIGDTSSRVLPLREGEIDEMLSELRGRALLDTWRGRPALHREALHRVVTLIADLMIKNEEIDSIDLNPVRLWPDGAMVLDATFFARAAASSRA